jgi:nitrite reductase (NADH) large subunit
MRALIIGNGIAGINVASGLSSREGVTVDVFSEETHPFYSRVRLPEVLSGAQRPDAITFYKNEWYEKKGIAVHTGKRATSIDRAAKTVSFSDGTVERYDALVLATGASSNKPPIPGSERTGVYTMRTLEDVASIRESVARDGSTASVVGGGLLGLEAARALKDGGVKDVRVFEIAPRLLPRQLDETGADILRLRFVAMGIHTVCFAETVSFETGTDGARASAINLKDGRTFPSATTLLSMGVKPNTALAAAAGLPCGRGIKVDNRMRTEDPSIYAVGDCAEFDGVVWGIIPAALEQAPIAAKSILHSFGILAEGDAPTYTQTIPKTALKVGDIELMSLGKAVLTDEESASGKYTIVSKVAADCGRYEKFVLEPNDGASVLVGAILLGSKAHQAQAQKMMGSHVSHADVDALLADF